MQQIKIFKGNESDLGKLEAEVNGWLASQPIRVVQMFGNIAPQGHKTDLQAIDNTYAAYVPSDVLLVVLYDKP